MAGCPEVARQVEQTRQEVSSAKANVQQQIRKIQQHGLIDLEVQQVLGAIHEAYRARLDQATPPQSWNDLEFAAASPSLIQEAQRRQARLALGLSTARFRDPAAASELLALLPDENGDGGWSLSLAGEMARLDASQYAAAPLAVPQ